MKNLKYNQNITIGSLLLCSFLPACSGVEQPSNLEPEILIMQPTDITRNEATLQATVIEKGAPLSYFRFRYGPTPAMELESPVLKVTGKTVSYPLENLTPSSLYYCMAEGGDGHTVVKSPSISFSTMPYELPALSAPYTLSSGPVGTLISFSIESDGGTPILTCGCDVTNLTTGEQTRLMNEETISVGKAIKMYISVDNRESNYSITPFASNQTGEAFAEPIIFTPRNSITLDEAGTLSLMEKNIDFASNSIVITGKMNGDDFRFLRLILGAPALAGESSPKQTVSDVDLSDTFIVDGGASYDGGRYTEKDIVSTGLFANCSALSSIILPSSASTLQQDAFSGSSQLKSVVLPPMLVSFSPSADCLALENIEITDGNSNFLTKEGVLFNSTLKEILWFPAGKQGDYSIPESVTSIGVNTFRDSKLNSLSFPPNLTSIGRGALAGTNIREVTLPSMMENVPESLCQNNTSLSVVRLGANISYIGNFAFAGCPLTDIYLASPFPPMLGQNVFGSDPAVVWQDCVLHVVPSAMAIYRNHSVWGKFLNIKSDL